MIAAAAAARSGADTLLIERYAFLGGTGTGGLMTCYNGFRNQRAPEVLQTVKGIPAEYIAELVALGLRVETHLGYGEPAEEIIRWANESKLDLLVMGTHGHRFPQDALFGATATRVRHKLRIPVFMVRVE